MTTSRRNFLKLFGLGAAAIVAPEPVKRYWFFGLDGAKEPQLAPGEIRLANGVVVRLVDFRECDKYDTIIISPERAVELVTDNEALPPYYREDRSFQEFFKARR